MNMAVNTRTYTRTTKMLETYPSYSSVDSLSVNRLLDLNDCDSTVK